MSPLSFCAFDPSQTEVIYELLAKTFVTSHAELQCFYQKLRDDFNYDGWPPSVFADSQFFSPLDQRFQLTYQQASIVACDLPSLLSRGGQKLVMIVAQDALSDEPAAGKVRLGTSYALHLKKCREELHNTRRYFQMIEVLLNQGYQVYLTDLYKIYVGGGAKLPRKDKQRFHNILQQEVELLRPQALITWGSKARRVVEKLKTERPHYTYPHPSGAARGAWAKLMGRPATDQNILNYWQLELSKQLEV